MSKMKVLCAGFFIAAAAASTVPAEEVVYVVNNYIHNTPQPDWSTVMMLRGSDLEILQTLRLPVKDAHSAALSPDMSRLWVTTANGNHTFVIDTASFQVIQEYDYAPAAADPMGVAVSPGGLSAWVGLTGSNTVERYDAGSFAGIAPAVDAGISPAFLVFTPDGTRVCVSDMYTKVRVFRASDMVPQRTYTFDTAAQGMGEAAVSPDGTILYISNMGRDRIERVMLQAPWMPLPPLSTAPYIKPRGIAISPDGNYLFIGHYMGTNSKVTMWQISPWALCALADIPINGRRVVANPDCSRIYVTEHTNDQCYAYRVNCAEESMFFDAVAELNTIEGQSASPIGIEVGDWEPHPSNYINLGVTPGYFAAGDAGALSWGCDFSAWNYRDVPVDVYLAVIKNPAVSHGPSTVEEALAGEEIWFYGRNMDYAYTGEIREPTWSNIAFPPVALSGALPFTARGGWEGHWAYAAAFVRRDTRGFVRTDGRPVENSNIFRLP